MPPIKMPKTLDIPSVEEIVDLETLKAHLRHLEGMLLMWFEHSQSDVAYIGGGNIGDTGNWRFHEMADGSMELQKKINGSWQEGDHKWDST